ncbi:MAG: nitrite reductase, copper-containing [Candidatus Tectomicrobia bacterium]|uniref:Copper-containing nitrite reductase n=1 Tax=Tectimicrobiota bacterium TaxID=2528274 RepID=A0A933GMD5_UNCTE|nr:nitrite reductase, copper-containing [Candidatus Tectomicrobia bacterium]
MRIIRYLGVISSVALVIFLLSCLMPESSQAEKAQLALAPQVPPPIARKEPAVVVVELEAIEKRAKLADGIEYEFWTFNGSVPAPFIRVRVGDTVEVHLKNNKNNKNTHTVDFHFITGPGGGANVLMTEPGKESVVRFKALKPGLYVYHCGAPPLPAHIAQGLYGMVLVEPEKGLPKVDREFYVMQSEFYTEGGVGDPGFQAFSSKKAAAERPEYVLFNGRVGSLMPDGGSPLKAKVGETVRIYFGNIGPNLVSSFHVVGEIFDKVYREGGVPGAGNPDLNVQTTLVPAGSASIVEFKVEVPGGYILVDHSIFRIDRGAAGILSVEGPEAPEIYSAKPKSAGH